jgi:hypothetical protein
MPLVTIFLPHVTFGITFLSKFLASMHIFYDTTSYQPTLTWLLGYFFGVDIFASKSLYILLIQLFFS